MSALRHLTRVSRSLVTARPITPIMALRPLHSSTVRNATKPPSDPFPLPLSDPELAALASKSESSLPLSEDSDEWPMPQPLDRAGEDADTLRARLVYQTRKRGTLETDLILSTFARDELPNMSIAEMQEFDKLLDEPDWDIFYWSVQKREPPPRWKDTPLLAKLIKHSKNEGKVVRMMPALMQRAPEAL